MKKEKIVADKMFEIGADGIDVEKIVSEISEEVARKIDAGVYRDARVARAEKTNLVNLKDDESFLRFYLECLRNAAFVDINDFTIRERRRAFGALLVALKKVVWKILKFYTYRLWTQQNQVNGLLVSAIEAVDEKYRNRIGDLEKKIECLEGKKADANEPCQNSDT